MDNGVQFTLNNSTNTDYGLSPQVWSKFPIGTVLKDPSLGNYFFDDFKDFPGPLGTQTTEIAFGKYKLFNTGAVKVGRAFQVNSVELQGGVMVLPTDTDNDSASLAQAFPSYFLSGLTSTSGPLCFEVCMAQKSVLTNMASSFIGLAETDLWTLATAVPLNASDAITNGGSAIGFRIEEDGLGVIDTVYSDRATSFTNIGDTEGGTLVANTFVKLGMIYDPMNALRCIRFFVNGVECTTAMTRAALVALTNLDANNLGLIATTCADSAGTAHELYMKWWAVGQLRPGVTL